MSHASLSYFDHLAGVRGLAAVVVLLSHVVQIHFLRFIGLNTPLHIASSVASEYAVVVFFILSGYLIAHTLEANIERHGRLRLNIFMAARFARLYPPLLFAVAVSVAVLLCIDWLGLPGRQGPLRLDGELYGARDIINLRPSEVVGALSMLQGMLEINGPLWSLYMEAKLYVLFACALALATGRRSPWLAAVFMVVAWAGLRFNPGFSGYAAVWLSGCVAYYAWSSKGVARSRLLLCAGMIVVILGAELLYAGLWAGAGKLPSTWREVLLAAVICWILFKWRIRLPISKRLADCSYSLYATHFPVLLLFQSLLLSTGSRSFAAAVGVALAGGRIEAQKSRIQGWLLASALRASQAMHCAR